MQRVIRRTALAKNQAQRKARIAAKKEQRIDNKEALRQRFQDDRYRLDAEKNARTRRRDDWMRGPLAPKRDSGPEAQYYGALPPHAVHAPKVAKHLQRKFINLAPGDRVCLLKGQNKGKILEVMRVDPETETVTVKNAMQADVHTPEWLNEAYGSKRPYNPFDLPIPIDDVRLVVALDDSATGIPRDVLVEHVYAGGPFMDRPYGSSTPKHTRYIAGDDIEIPWPGEDTPEPYKDEEWDTLRMEVETLTHKPSLEYAPFESSIMDELRNKYSKYRTRHDPEWVEAKKVEDLRREYLQTRTLLTPGGEAKLRRAAEKAEVRKAQLDADGNYILNKETSSFIERFMREQAVKGKASTA